MPTFDNGRVPMLHDEIMELRKENVKQFEALGRIESAVTGLPCRDHLRKIASIEKETHKLAQWRWLVTGGMALAVFVLGLLIKVI